MQDFVYLPQGSHVLAESTVGWKAKFLDAQPPAVELVASIESGPRQTSAPTLGQTATTLAIPMDAQVAIRLYEELGDLIRDMGWQQYVEGERPI